MNLRKLTTIGNNDGLRGGSASGSNLLDRPYDVHSFNNLSEHDVFSIEPLGFLRTDEELRSVGIRTGIGHGEDSRTGVLLFEILVGEFVTIDGLTAGAVTSGEITALAHEIGDHTVE